MPTPPFCFVTHAATTLYLHRLHLARDILLEHPTVENVQPPPWVSVVFEAVVEENAIRLRIGSELHLVNEAVRACTRFASVLAVDEPIALSLILRELLLNAVKHGNQCDPKRQVTVDIGRAKDGALRLQITDEGTGFNYRALNLDLPIDSTNFRRHGYMLIAALSDRVEFNGCGNSVTAWLRTDRTADETLSEHPSHRVDMLPDAHEVAEHVSRLVRQDDGRNGRPWASHPAISFNR